MSAKYHQDSKERLQKKAGEKYHCLSEGGKKEKRKLERERYTNLSEDEKQKLVAYRKNIIEKWKSEDASQIKTYWSFLI